MGYKHTPEALEAAVNQSRSVMQVLEHLGLAKAGGNHSHISRRIREAGIDTSHFGGQAWNRGVPSTKRKAKEDILVLRESGARTPVSQLRRAMIESGMAHHCALCSLTETWNDEPIVLEIDHIDGNWLDNRIDNVRFLCPNCHSQQIVTNRLNN